MDNNHIAPPVPRLGHDRCPNCGGSINNPTPGCKNDHHIIGNWIKQWDRGETLIGKVIGTIDCNVRRTAVIVKKEDGEVAILTDIGGGRCTAATKEGVMR